jgi:serine/threonine protein kinase
MRGPQTPVPHLPREASLLGDVRRTHARQTSREDEPQGRRRSALPSEGEILGGHYRLVRRLGEGMFGRVFVAERTDVREHRVAMKVMTRAVYENRNVERELTMLAAASHPHIVQLKDHGVTADVVWLTMPLYEGETLAQRLERGPLGLREAYTIFLPIARGVQALHERGLRHQDIKPENIFLARFSDTIHPVLLDLGVAVEKRSEFVAGTILYGSPEQVMALAGLGGVAGLNERMDTYCLATTLLRALAGEESEAVNPPATPLALANWFERRERDPLPSEALEDLTGAPRKKLVLAFKRWLQRDPSERATMKELAEELDVLLEQEREAALAIERSLAKQKIAFQRVRVALGAMAVLAAGAGFYTFSKRETLRLAGELERARTEGAASFDKLDTCIASHDLERRKSERCETERREAESEHTRSLTNVAHGSESALQTVERKSELLRFKLRGCQDDAEKAELDFTRQTTDLESLWNGRSVAWTEERTHLVTDRDEVKRDRDELKRDRDEVKRDRDELKRDRDELKRDHDELKRDRDELKRDRDELKRDRDELKKSKTNCEASLTAATDSRDSCKSDLTSCSEERRACHRASSKNEPKNEPKPAEGAEPSPPSDEGSPAPANASAP